MESTDNDMQQPLQPVPDDGAGQPPRRGNAAWVRLVAALAVLAAIVAWGALIFSEYLSSGAAVAAVGLAVAGICGSRRGFVRDASITALIASGVLLVVYALLYFGLNFAISSL